MTKLQITNQEGGDTEQDQDGLFMSSDILGGDLLIGQESGVKCWRLARVLLAIP
jgi:hypothetical protein